uniref:Uncharacterized protein n=1 Tax=Anguilla anguilla TaxID=7936 RepID=A0A0E9R4W1_ANGAN
MGKYESQVIRKKRLLYIRLYCLKIPFCWPKYRPTF